MSSIYSNTPLITEAIQKANALPDKPTLIEKTVTTNGTYNASADSADGYSKVIVAIPTYDGTVV